MPHPQSRFLGQLQPAMQNHCFLFFLFLFLFLSLGVIDSHDIHCTDVALSVHLMCFANGWGQFEIELKYSTSDFQFNL